jgi:hypothetical protein
MKSRGMLSKQASLWQFENISEIERKEEKMSDLVGKNIEIIKLLN